MTRKHYPLKWWQLWRFNPYWHCFTFRYKWVRYLYNKINIGIADE